MSRIIKWKALQACVAGGAYREAGEVFEAPDTDDYAEDVRVRLGEDESNDNGESAEQPKGSARAKQPKGSARAQEAPGVMPDELPPMPV